MEVRRSGQKSLYRARVPPGAQAILDGSAGERRGGDRGNARTTTKGCAWFSSRRKDHLRSYFDELAGRFGRSYVPGRSWKALAEMLLRLLPPLVIADSGRGRRHAVRFCSRSAPNA